jgi:hypothetical protein
MLSVFFFVLYQFIIRAFIVGGLFRCAPPCLGQFLYKSGIP